LAGGFTETGTRTATDDRTRNWTAGDDTHKVVNSAAAVLWSKTLETNARRRGQGVSVAKYTLSSSNMRVIVFGLYESQ